jgi:hypothetical protein
MKIAATTSLIIILASSRLAGEPHEDLLRLSVVCQNAALKQAQGVTDRSQFSDYIKASDETLADLVRSGFLVEEHLLMRAPSRMNGNERVHFEQQRMKLVDELSPRFGYYTVVEMMGWEFREQIQGGRFFKPDRDESKDFRLRVRLSEVDLKKFKALLGDYILRTIPKNEIGEQEGSGQPAIRSELKVDGGDKPEPESEGDSLSAQKEAPLHLVISEVGNRIVTYGTEDEPRFTLMAEISNALNFSLRGDFTKAEILSASTVAPDGKTYQLKAIGEHPPACLGTLLQFLFIVYGDAHTGFSIGKWDLTIKFKVDGQDYDHKTTYLVTWRKPEEGIWQGQHWANESPAESGPRE